MNRRQRRALQRETGMRVWTQLARCVECGRRVVHVELMPAGDEPYGMPPGARCDCGGEVVAPRRDHEAVGVWVEGSD